MIRKAEGGECSFCGSPGASHSRTRAVPAGTWCSAVCYLAARGLEPRRCETCGRVIDPVYLPDGSPRPNQIWPDHYQSTRFCSRDCRFPGGFAAAAERRRRAAAESDARTLKPSLRWCSSCGRECAKDKGRHVQDRPTGRGGETRRWAYCGRCWAEYSAMVSARDGHSEWGWLRSSLGPRAFDGIAEDTRFPPSELNYIGGA